MVLFDAFHALPPFRAAPARADGNAHLTPRAASSVAAWKIGQRSVTDPSGRVIRLVRHGLDAYAATQLLGSATVLHGDFPQVSDVTTDRAKIQELMESLCPRGELLSVYASLYRDQSRTVLLLDYLH